MRHNAPLHKQNNSFKVCFLLLLVLFGLHWASAQETTATPDPTVLAPISARGTGGVWASNAGQQISISLYTIDGAFVAVLRAQGVMAWDDQGRLTSSPDDLQFIEIQTSADSERWYGITDMEIQPDGLLSITAEEGVYSLLPLAVSNYPTNRAVADVTITEAGDWSGTASFFITGFGAGSFAAYIYADVRNYNIPSLGISATVASTTEAPSEQPTAMMDEAATCPPHVAPENVFKLTWSENNPIMVNEETPFFIPTFDATGRSAGGAQLVITNARFDITGLELDGLVLGRQVNTAEQVTHQAFVFLPALRERDLTYFDIDEQGILFPENVDCVDENAPFITVIPYSQEQESILEGWDITLIQGEETLSAILPTTEEEIGLYTFGAVGAAPVTVRAVDPETSEVFEYVLYPAIRSADFEIRINYFISNLTDEANKVVD